MRYTVTADVPDADRSDTYLHETIIGAFRDMRELRSEGLGYHVEVFRDSDGEPVHRGNIGDASSPQPFFWFEIETSQEVFDRYGLDPEEEEADPWSADPITPARS